MNSSEETKYMDPVDESQDTVEEVEENVENSKMETWKAVTIGGLSGILMGAGALYALDASAESSDALPAPGSIRTNEQTGIKVAAVSDEMSFGEAFATARHAVGGGGVFHWRGNVYNTFTKEEWDAMTPAERNAFAREVQPEITAEANLHPHHADHHHDVAHDQHHEPSGGKKAQDNEEIAKGSGKKTEDNEEIAKGSGKKTEDNEEIAKGGGKKTEDNEETAKGDGKGTDDDDIKTVTDDDDIRVIGTDEIEGHSVAFIDTTGNGETDVAIIDVDGDKQLSEADILVDNEGNAMTLGGDVVSTSDFGYSQDDSFDSGADGLLDATLV